MPCSASSLVPGLSRPEPLAPAGPAQPLLLSGAGRPVLLPGRLLLAPMDGITEPVFRRLIAAEGGVAGLCSEFVRISVAAVPVRVCRRHLLPVVAGVPTALQLMAAVPDLVAASAANAERAGAAWIDLNFGCPAPVVFGKCAGSALLDRPQAMAAMVMAARAGTGLPVTAKVRAGIADPARLEENLLALAEAGAAAITIHARLRVQGYHQPATWEWIARGVAALRAAGHRLPVVGNGSIDEAGQIAAMRCETGCDAVMVGRALLADPFLFRVAAGGSPPDAAEAAAWPARYHHEVSHALGASTALAKLKQQIRWYRAGGLFSGCEEDRRRLLRSSRAEPILAWLDEVSRRRASCG